MIEGVSARIVFIEMSVIFIFGVVCLCGRVARCLATAAVCTEGLIGSCSTATISCTTFTLCSSPLSFPSHLFCSTSHVFSYPSLSSSYLFIPSLSRSLFFWPMNNPAAISAKPLPSSTFQLHLSRYRLHPSRY